MTAQEIINQLKPLGTDAYKNILLKHGAVEPLFGVKIEELKKIQKVVKKDYQLALALYDTGIYDAMYLAGLIADDRKMSRDDLEHWAATANCPMISEYTVPWVAAEGLHGRELGLRWIDSSAVSVASSGWMTLSGLVALTDDAELDLAELARLLQRVQKTLAGQPERVRYSMNGFVIAVACYVAPLSDIALRVGAAIAQDGAAGKLLVVADALEKVRKRGSLGKKRKTVKC